MKTLKLTIVVCFMALALVSFGQTVKMNILPVILPQELSISVTIDQARTMPALLNAIYYQIDPSFLNFHKKGNYTFIIRIKSVRYAVYGNYNQWAAFFAMQPLGPPNESRIDR